jgi:hypothetical protein
MQSRYRVRYACTVEIRTSPGPASESTNAQHPPGRPKRPLRHRRNGRLRTRRSRLPGARQHRPRKLRRAIRLAVRRGHLLRIPRRRRPAARRRYGELVVDEGNGDGVWHSSRMPCVVQSPTMRPTTDPTLQPTRVPTLTPSEAPTRTPTDAPRCVPCADPLPSLAYMCNPHPDLMLNHGMSCSLPTAARRLRPPRWHRPWCPLSRRPSAPQRPRQRHQRACRPSIRQLRRPEVGYLIK